MEINIIVDKNVNYVSGNSHYAIVIVKSRSGNDITGHVGYDQISRDALQNGECQITIVFRIYQSHFFVMIK